MSEFKYKPLNRRWLLFFQLLDKINVAAGVTLLCLLNWACLHRFIYDGAVSTDSVAVNLVAVVLGVLSFAAIAILFIVCVSNLVVAINQPSQGKYYPIWSECENRT
jgi:hypothetical protein